MNKSMIGVIALAVGLAVGIVAGCQTAPAPAEAPAAMASGFAAVPGEIGGHDLFGPYDVVQDWPKGVETLPGHEEWMAGAAQGIFAQNPNRVYLLARGELPYYDRVPLTKLSEIGPGLQFPIGGLPFRSATQTALPANGGAGGDPATGRENWENGGGGRVFGVDARWEHTLVVVNEAGDIIEEWTQWDEIFKRPHSVYISPYDAEKHVWVVDDHSHAIHKFTNDGQELVQTLGTRDELGADGTHFNRPTFMAWDGDGNIYVADGYNGTRVAKFDTEGNFLLDWGMAGEPGGNETRPGYWNNVHGVAVDVPGERVFVNDRGNHRIQIFDLDGNYLSEWGFSTRPSSIHLIQIGQEGTLVAYDQGNQKLLKYDLDGHLMYSWGTVANLQGSLWGVHGISTDQEGNLYTAGVNSGKFNKFTPKPGANPAYMIDKPIYSAWQE